MLNQKLLDQRKWPRHKKRLRPMLKLRRRKMLPKLKRSPPRNRKPLLKKTKQPPPEKLKMKLRLRLKKLRRRLKKPKRRLLRPKSTSRK